MNEHIAKWRVYSERRDYLYRVAKLQPVVDRLFAEGLADGDVLMDVGAGTCALGQYLRERGWRGLYVPVDAAVDGVDLAAWTPPAKVDWVVCLEVVEHLQAPLCFIDALGSAARKGLIVSTPNPAVVNVAALDSTHVSEVSVEEFAALGMEYRVVWGGETILAWASERTA